MNITKKRLWEISRGSQPTQTEILLMALELYGARDKVDEEFKPIEVEKEEHETRYGTLVPWGGG